MKSTTSQIFARLSEMESSMANMKKMQEQINEKVEIIIQALKTAHYI